MDPMVKHKKILIIAILITERILFHMNINGIGVRLNQDKRLVI